MADRGVVAVAVSGGRDSLALLHVARRSAGSLGLGVVALHVHHGLMAEADRWQAGLEALCGRWNVKFACTRLAGAPAAGESVEAWARRERYRALARMARAAGAGLVLLGHHRHDQAETVLLQALRGAGPAGLAAMPGVIERDGLTWARPWLARTGAEIDAVLAPLALVPVHDPSNADPRFARSRLRTQVMPALRSAFPDAEVALAKVAARAGETRALLAEIAADDLARIGAGAALPLAAWLALSPARRANALRAWLAPHLAGGVPETLVRRVLGEAVDQSARRWLLADARVLRAWRGRLSVVGPAPARARPGDESGPRAGAGQAGGIEAPLSLLRCGSHPVPGFAGALEVFAVDRAGLCPRRLVQVLARARTGGERFRLQPAGMARSLKKQYQAASIAVEGRSGPLLFDRHGELLFAPGLGVDAHAWAEPGAPQWGLRWRPCVDGEG